ncbi:hypothetical protein ACOMHN_050325 [Nucella lapillus]
MSFGVFQSVFQSDPVLVDKIIADTMVEDMIMEEIIPLPSFCLESPVWCQCPSPAKRPFSPSLSDSAQSPAKKMLRLDSDPMLWSPSPEKIVLPKTPQCWNKDMLAYGDWCRNPNWQWDDYVAKVKRQQRLLKKGVKVQKAVRVKEVVKTVKEPEKTPVEEPEPEKENRSEEEPQTKKEPKRKKSNALEDHSNYCQELLAAARAPPACDRVPPEHQPPAGGQPQGMANDSGYCSRSPQSPPPLPKKSPSRVPRTSAAISSVKKTRAASSIKKTSKGQKKATASGGRGGPSQVKKGQALTLLSQQAKELKKKKNAQKAAKERERRKKSRELLETVKATLWECLPSLKKKLSQKLTLDTVCAFLDTRKSRRNRNLGLRKEQTKLNNRVLRQAGIYRSFQANCVVYCQRRGLLGLVKGVPASAKS